MLFSEAIAAAIHQKELDGVIKDPKNFFFWHSKAVLKVLGDHEIESITTEMLEEYRHARAKAFCNATANKDFQVITFTFRLALRKKWIKKNPLDDLNVRKLPEDEKPMQFLQVDERRALQDGCAPALEAAKKFAPWAAPIDKIEALASNTGMQKSELLRLDEAWFVRELKLLRLPKIKKRPPRDIPLNEVAFKIVCGLFDDPKRKTNFLIVNPRTGKPYTNIRKILKSAVEKSGLKRKVTLHQLRHTFGTAALTAGVEIETIAELMGHRDPSTTRRYAKVISPKKVDAMEKLNRLLEGPTPAPLPDAEILERPAGNVVYFEKLKEPKKLQG